MQWVEIYKAQSIIERDAILSALKENEIECQSPERTIVRKVTDNTIDVSHGVYSAFFEGFQIFVNEPDKFKALEIINKIVEDAKMYDRSKRLPPLEQSALDRRVFYRRLFATALLLAYAYFLINNFIVKNL